MTDEPVRGKYRQRRRWRLERWTQW